MAQTLAKKLKLSYVDNQILKLAARQLGLTEQELVDIDGKAPAEDLKFVKTAQPSPAQLVATGNGSADYTSLQISRAATQNGDDSRAHIWHNYHNLVEELIKSTARHGNAVILGRAANQVLKGWSGVVNVLVHAPLQNRIERLSYLEHIDRATAAQRIEHLDQQRAHYARYYYGVDWKDPDQYDLVINTAAVPLTVATEAVSRFVKEVHNSINKTVNPLTIHCSYDKLTTQDDYTLKEAADLLMTNPDLLRQAVYRGDLKGKIVDHRVVSISREALLEWMQNSHLS